MIQEPLPKAMGPSRTAVAKTYDKRTARPAAGGDYLAGLSAIIGRAFLRLQGWKIEGDWPGHRKAVLLAAPHTSNLDGFLMLATAAHYRVKLRWMGKKSLTAGPFGRLLLWLGCVPVDRSAAHGLVGEMAAAFEQADQMVLAVPPEGTRGQTTGWKQGYYHIAHAANVPIIFSVLDFGTKTVRLSGELLTRGDYEADWPTVRAHYRSARGTIPSKFQLPD